jgi:putative methyltransferase (TIGR04325 family)
MSTLPFAPPATSGAAGWIAKALVKLGKLPAAGSLLRGLPATAAGRRVSAWLVPYRRPFPSFEAARAAADRAAGDAHVNPANLREHLEFETRPSDYPVLLHLSRLAGPISLFDLGGNVGNLFYSYSRFLAAGQIGSWRVFDLPETARVGARLASRRGVADRLVFADSLDGMDGADVLLASGSLHYFEQRIDRMLAALATKPRHVLINRSPLHTGAVTYTIQDAGFGLIACKLYNKAELIAGMQAIGYELADAWRIYECSLDIPFYPDLSVDAYSGLYFRLQGRGTPP